MSRHLRHGKMKKLTREDRVKRELRNQQRTKKQVKKGTGATWSLSKIVEEQRQSRLDRIKQRLGLDP